MTERVEKYLSDVLVAIEFIEEFTKETIDFNSYSLDFKTQSATERKLVIIGEALTKIRQEESTIEVSFGKEIIGFRNRLVHAYDSIDNAIVWTIIKRHLPQLKTEINNLIESNK
jgi:uncharacterized protein with HEPN domain